MSFNSRILIIGSGAAGYAAACKLLEYGYSNINILEAENRIGGRINSVKFGNGMVDLGAQWCHGEENNIVYEMVKDLKLVQPSISNFENFVFVDSQGNFIDSNLTEKLLSLLYEISEDLDKMKLHEGTFGDYMIENFEEQINSHYPDINRKLSKQFLNFYHKLINNLNACTDWFEMSTKYQTIYQECQGNQTLNWKDKGYQTIFSVLKKEIPDPSEKLSVDEKILLNKEVTKIIWDDLNKKRSNKITVKCSDGSVYNADHVITTVSLGVLKECHNTLFVPELPTYKKCAIEGLSIGCVNKVFLKFSKKWWPDDFIGFSLLWSDEDIEKTLEMFPEGPNKNGISWLTSIYGFYPVDCNPNVLFFFVNNDFSREIETLSNDEIAAGCTYLLQKFVGKYYNIPVSEAVLRSSWFSNKHFRGSYSYSSLKSEHMNVTPAALARPLGNNAVLFAGEATHSTFFSTVHGAIETGFREAYRIISHYKSQFKLKNHL